MAGNTEGARQRLDCVRSNFEIQKSTYPPIKAILSSESHFQCKLRRARTSELIEGVESACASTQIAQTLREILERITKDGCCENSIGRSEIGVIENIEQFGAKL